MSSVSSGFNFTKHHAHSMRQPVGSQGGFRRIIKFRRPATLRRLRDRSSKDFRLLFRKASRRAGNLFQIRASCAECTARFSAFHLAGESRALIRARRDTSSLPNPYTKSNRRARLASRRFVQNGAKSASVFKRNQPTQTLSPLPWSPTLLIPSFQSPEPISGKPCEPTAKLRSSVRAQCS